MTTPSATAGGKAPGERYAELDLLRFIAALSVVAYHYSAFQVPHASGTLYPFAAIMPVTQYGYLGVNLFFLISGFVILASALNRSCLEFAISRAARLYPTYWVAVCLTTLTIYMLAPPEAHIEPLRFLANLTMLNDYAGIQDIDGVYWTLHAELKFYFMIFVLIATGLIKHIKLWLGVWTATTACYLLTHQPFFLGWIISPSYSSYFIGGAAFYLIRKEGPQPFYQAIAAISLALSSIYAFRQASGFLHAPTPSECWTATAIIWLSYAIFYAIARGWLTLKSTPTLLILGGLTYPLYLIHAKIGHLLFDALTSSLNPYLATACIVLFMCLLSYALHLYIEKRASNALRQSLDKLLQTITRRKVRN